jgi:hypothetical protein
MKEHSLSRQQAWDGGYNPLFLQFFREFAAIDDHEKLFPKQCRTCGRTFRSLARYLEGTVAKAHSLEDCEDTMLRPYTMTYRHCSCGNTLVLTFTDETYSLLPELWSVLRAEADGSGKPLPEVVKSFSAQWEHYMLTHCPTGN